MFSGPGEDIPISGKTLQSGFLYKLKKPSKVLKDGKVFYVEYVSDKDTDIELMDENGGSVEFSVPGSGKNPVRYQFPLNRNFTISGFVVKGIKKNGEGFSLISSGLEDEGYGYYLSGTSEVKASVIKNGIVIDGGYSFSFGKLSKAVDLRLNQVQIALRYRCSCRDTSYASVVLSSGDKTRKHSVAFRNTEETLYFYSDEEGFVPDKLDITGVSGSFTVVSLEIKPFSRLVPLSYNPVPADLGVILGYDKKHWRRSDFEIFSWSMFPGFLVIEFDSYALQASFLKRLAFFVEKKGFAGSLLPDDRLKTLHGWNAHDYRAEDLARFFNLASEEGFSLNGDEHLLLDILLHNGILRMENGKAVPVSGGFLAFSSESSPRLRYLFITHEGYHGVFFSSPEYRWAVEKIWNDLSGEEKNFWRIFLDWKRYNTDDEYLLINEFQAYLMQQDTGRVNAYYKDYIIPRMKKYKPSVSGTLDSFVSSYPDHFTDSSRKVEDALFRVNGLAAGELRSVLD